MDRIAFPPPNRVANRTKPRGQRLSRRAVLGLGAAASVLPRFAWAENEPIKVGFLSVATGALAAGGKQMEEGLAFFLGERNGALSGRKVEIVTADTGGIPAQAKAKAQDLVEKQHVQVLIGPLASVEAVAVDEYLAQAETPVPLITPTPSVDWKPRRPNQWIIHAVGTTPQVAHPLGDYAAKTLKYRRAATLADDFTDGYDGAGGFHRAFEASGGKIVQKLWSPLSATDYAPFIAQIKHDIDALYIGYGGVNSLRFLQQFAQSALHGKIPLLGNITTTDESVLRLMGDAALGVVTSGWYSAALEARDTQRFVEGIRVHYNHDPGCYAAGAYTAGLFLEAATAALEGDLSNPEALRQALRNARPATGPIGPIGFDGFSAPILDVHIRKVERRNNRLVNAVLTTYHGVSQFWTYDPEQFIADPVYSRDFPPAKYLE